MATSCDIAGNNLNPDADVWAPAGYIYMQGHKGAVSFERGTYMLTTTEAAAHIGKSASWLNKSRMNGSGPVYMKLGATVRYAVVDLDNWIAAQRRTAVYDFANDNARAALAA